jgi:hypothetical protein
MSSWLCTACGAWQRGVKAALGTDEIVADFQSPTRVVCLSQSLIFYGRKIQKGLLVF